MSQQLATITTSMPRRVFGLAVLFGLGGLVLYIALSRSHEVLAWQAFLLVLGGLVLWLGDRMRRATAQSVILTEAGLVDTAGREIARLDEIAAVNRGMFAFKPSNGFVLRLTASKGNAWAPGLWWRVGRRVGIGGVTAAGQTKFMAEMLTAMLAERDG